MRYLKKVITIPLLLKILFRRILHVKKLGYTASFELEGGVEIKLPKISAYDGLSKSGRGKIFKVNLFADMPLHEALLRKVVYELFQIGYINCNNSIIDIGCYIGDNSLVWSKLLKKGNVYAIEGVHDSLHFASNLARINNIDNITFINAICADIPNVPLVSSGSHGGTSFNQSSSGIGQKSTTIDEVIPLDCHGAIDLFHIDVEGFEEKVLLGSKRVIQSSRPVIIFEQHISSENVTPIIKFLEDLEYTVFMINEVLPGNRLDCRNFIAFDSKRPLPKLPNLENPKGMQNNIWFATLGPSIVRFQS
jgi:FkbM family methyltransferase